MAETLSVAVVGGGLGGLAAAVALTRAGFDVDVFERASQFGEVGAGINISPQATKALTGIGLGPALAAAGDRMSGQLQRSMYTGEQLAETVLGNATGDRYGAPYYVFHRADLLDVLASAVSPGRRHLNHRAVGFEEDGDGVTVIFEHGRRHRADLLVGADGIHSVVRGQLYGREETAFTGQMVWRALVDGSAIPPDTLGPHGFCGWIGRGRHMMTYYLRGRSVVNITTQSDADTWVEEGWSIRGDPDEMRAGFPGAAPDLQVLLDAVTSCSKWGLFGRTPTDEWGTDRVQLIGDAAHPMLPNAGQGAAQAFEDAYVLARWVASSPHDLAAALAGFRNVRIPRAHAIQRLSLANSKLVHAGDWEQRQELFRARERQGDTPLGMGWIYDYEPKQEWSVRREYRTRSESAQG